MANLTTRYGRYEVLETRGSGGQGRVVRARDVQHDRIVALKIRPAGPGVDRSALLAEARVLLELKPHPGLPYVRDDFFSEDEYVIVMDWIDGVDLRTLLSRQGDPGLPVQSVIAYMSQVAEALDHLHGHRPPVIHGDVKPANCVLTEDGRVVLVDFGIATGTGHERRIGLGTRGYVAPEVAAGRPPLPASDVYGLAAATFTLLSGVVPDADWPEFEGVAPAEARALSRAIRLGLSTDPHRRPSSARELIERLRGWREADLPTGVITFLMTDVEGSTGLWERGADSAARAIARHEVIIGDVVDAGGGKVIKSRGEGDSTTSVFVRASDALATAVAIQRALRAETWPDGAVVRVRVALHTGEAQLRDGDYFGMTPNRAARLKSFAGGGEIVCSQATVELVTDPLDDDVRFVDLGSRELRGSTRPERIYRLDHPDLSDAGRGATTPPEVSPVPFPSWLDMSRAGALSGRADELDRLRAMSELAREGRAVVSFVSGEPGIGKTRLVGEFAALVRDEDAVVVLAGRCFEDSLVPYQPFAEALRSYVDALPPRHLAAQLGRFSRQLAVVVPRFAVDVPHAVSAAHAENERYLFFDAVASALLSVCDGAPLLLVLDDLQWADPSTLLLLRHLLRDGEGSSLHVVGTYRDTDAPSPTPIAETAAELSRTFVVDTIALRGLQAGDIGALVDSRSAHRADPGLAQAIWRETDGNPLFALELISHLIETGRIEDTPSNEGGFGIPDNVRDLVSRRLSRLSSSARTTLTFAAVVGQEFRLTDVLPVAQIEMHVMVDALDECVAARLVVEDDNHPGVYRFAHAVVRSAIYGDLTRTRRAHMHEQVGTALEAIGRTDAATLAYHFSQAGPSTSDRAVYYERAAGDRALEQLAYERAARHYRAALAAYEPIADADESVRCDLMLSLGRALYTAGERDDSRSTFIDAADLARDIDPERYAEAALGVGGPAWGKLGQTDPVLVELIEDALTRIGRDPSVLRARLLARLALEFTLGDEIVARVDQLSREALDTARALDDADALVYALVSRQWCVWGPGAWKERLDCANEVIRIAPISGRYELIHEGRQARLLAFLESGDVASLDAELEAEARLVDDLRIPLYRATHTQDRAMRALLDGRLDEAEQLANASLVEGGQDDNIVLGYGAQLLAIRWEQDRLGEMIELIRQVVEDNPYLQSFRCALALAYSECGRTDEAVAEFATIARTGFDRLDLDTLTLSLAVLSVAVANERDQSTARQLYPLLVPYADEIVNARLAICWGSTHRYLGILARTIDDVDTAEMHFRDALDVHERMRSDPWIAHSLTDLGLLFIERGDETVGRPLVDRAAGIGHRLGLERLLRRLDEGR